MGKSAKKQTPLHAHGCRDCGARFEDACLAPNESGQCYECRTGRPGWQVLIENRRPKDCCRAHARLARKEEIERYSLSAACAWYICPVCQRSHPFTDPTKE